MADVNGEVNVYDGPYGTVTTTKRPPHRQFPQQAWGLQTGCWSSFGEYFPRSGGFVTDPKEPTASGEYVAPRNKAEAGVKKNNTSVCLGFDAVPKRSTYQYDFIKDFAPMKPPVN